MRTATLLCVFLLLGIGNVSATATAPAPTTFCIKVDGCALDLITSVFKRRISLSMQCCQGLSAISDDCFYKEFTHSKRVPFFLGKVKNYCSHAAVNNAASPTYAAPSPSPVDNAASPTHVAPSSSSILPSHMAPTPAPTYSCINVKGCAPTYSCINVKGCAIDLITSVFRRKISLSTQCCQQLSAISNDCFYREFTHFKRVPFFLVKVRNYCSRGSMIKS